MSILSAVQDLGAELSATGTKGEVSILIPDTAFRFLERECSDLIKGGVPPCSETRVTVNTHYGPIVVDSAAYPPTIPLPASPKEGG